MSVWHDLIDWVGGYPFEVAKPEEVFAFYRTKGFTLVKLKTCAGGLGCNEYVFAWEKHSNKEAGYTV
jgi:2-polyprenyl-6-hydroxyphenyl methylase/3-demethylubiquinone-9 3-methyltransferase